MIKVDNILGIFANALNCRVLVMKNGEREVIIKMVSLSDLK